MNKIIKFFLFCTGLDLNCELQCHIQEVIKRFWCIKKRGDTKMEVKERSGLRAFGLMEAEAKERNELIAITFSHSVEMVGSYFMYVVRMPNYGYPKYYYKVYHGVSEKDANKQAFIDEIAGRGDKYSYAVDSIDFVNRNIKDREDREEKTEEDEEY